MQFRGYPREYPDPENFSGLMFPYPDYIFPQSFSRKEAKENKKGAKNQSDRFRSLALIPCNSPHTQPTLTNYIPNLSPAHLTSKKHYLELIPQRAPNHN